MDCTTETPRRRPGPKPRQIECRGERLTIEEWAEKTGLEPGTIRFRLYQLKWPASLALALPLGTHASRAGDVREEHLLGVSDVTDEPKKKPAGETVDPVKQQRQDIDAIMSRRNEPGNIMDERARLEMAWAMGHGCGARR